MSTFSRICNDQLLQNLFHESVQSPRKRTHFEMHSGQNDRIQKFLNVLQPGSYIPPHLHAEKGKWESFQIIRGAIKVILFSDEGVVNDTLILSAKSGNYIAEIAEKNWHSIVALEKDTALLELKPGPYDPDAAKHFAPWAPQEGDKHAPNVVTWLVECSKGDQFIPQ